MKSLFRQAGLLIGCVMLMAAFFYLGLLLHLQRDHRRRPGRGAEITYQAATAVVSALEKFPRWLVERARPPQGGVRTGKARMTHEQALGIALFAYGFALYAVVCAAGHLRRTRRNPT